MVRLLTLVWGLTVVATANAQTISLGAAQSYAVLAFSAIDNIGPTVLNGSLGIYGAKIVSISGFPPGVYTGIESLNDYDAQLAQIDAATAYNTALALPCNTTLNEPDLGGKVLAPGVYCIYDLPQLAGVLTLNGQGDSNAGFVFVVHSTLTTAIASSVVLINGAQACDVFWAIAGDANLGSGTLFAGNIVASQSITLGEAVDVKGGLYALGDMVLLNTNQVSAQATYTSVAITTTSTTSSTIATSTTSTETTTSTTSTTSIPSTSTTSTSSTSTSTSTSSTSSSVISTSSSTSTTTITTAKASTSTSAKPPKTTLLIRNADNCFNAYRKSLTVASPFCSQYIRSTAPQP